jgi:16S rRNA (guanine527-N7)-methyltransferase
VVQAVADGLELKNVKAEQMRAENVKVISSRAVTNMPDFVSWVKTKIKRTTNTIENGILYLKEINRRVKDFPKATEYNLADFSKMNF